MVLLLDMVVITARVSAVNAGLAESWKLCKGLQAIQCR